MNALLNHELARVLHEERTQRLTVALGTRPGAESVGIGRDRSLTHRSDRVAAHRTDGPRWARLRWRILGGRMA
jgi:hypothetical protein